MSATGPHLSRCCFGVNAESHQPYDPEVADSLYSPIQPKGTRWQAAPCRPECICICEMGLTGYEAMDIARYYLLQSEL